MAVKKSKKTKAASRKAVPKKAATKAKPAARRAAAARTAGSMSRRPNPPPPPPPPPPPVNPNVMIVNMIPRSLSGETNHDSEPNLAVNPANPLEIAASAFTPNPAGAGDAPIFVSSDGGNSWALKAIVPSDAMTADITLRFGGTSNNLYAGILRTPFTSFDAQGQPIPTLNILRTNSVASSSPMTVLVDRTGQGVDQPYIQAATVGAAGGGAGGRDLVVVGDNDFNQASGQSAAFDVSANATAANPPFQTVGIDVRAPASGNAPSIRPSIHPEGAVYGAFLHGLGGNSAASLRYDVVVVRDDNFGNSPQPFTALTDPNDNLAGVRVVQNRLIPFLPDQPGEPGPVGQERIGSHLTIAVDPRSGQSATVYVAWADQVGAADYTIHLRKSTDSGRTWSAADLLTVTNAVNPAVAVNANGKVAFLYQQLTGPFTPGRVSAANRWETHLRRSVNGGATFDDLILATTRADVPQAQGLPYLGDYLHLMAIGRDFYGIFSANNTPDSANFPQGVVFQRNHNFAAKTLLDVDGSTPVAISIDPFFVKVTEN